MGKVIKRPKRRAAKRPSQQVLQVKGRDASELTPQELEQNRLAREMVRQWIEEAERMTPAEREEADRDWERFKNSMNESRRGYRIPYPD